MEQLLCPLPLLQQLVVTGEVQLACKHLLLLGALWWGSSHIDMCCGKEEGLRQEAELICAVQGFAVQRGKQGCVWQS